ncbi:hypothetical protein GLOIN_2v1779451 [Rhizophagus irregularis DAOM 181602=DAOM 197198]|uniref:Uncharacterized protein n=3 Tax=Rhizophagus irregularis TaxID=588596 RepID=A0A015KFG9_RHIIW|nr:hypothetical protein GLOIN_2v1779451 [Rhizophagus irregularis DAOM 181602=DAOM 197198]EXX66164.1 hypothetical protein RirG_126470 [Rhizophagus irregularis DAOM 197198w]POG67453.1 hypothetical protein GLOIN_2v1779451 [Rhizophagus irregularis DAOM 181602=DAOM 197198]GBC51066.1 hypothetical protein GLOIN_2v1779451 [Rhizophagus irregularis DAOM 181602=DAOM 197198]|eukprot:XP_025174319.1 hypothetical protein GLOIN_2v1779451 [Rhizophagus irregularis DAOM 181602=DAOM 197198]
MAMTLFFFLRFWYQHILNLLETYPNFISLKKNFLADQSYSILVSLAESIVLLVKAHREYYPSVPLLLWMHGSEAAEYFFGITRQINPDFTFAELIYIVPKIAQYSKALRNDNFIYAKEKSVREEYHFEYNNMDLNIEQLKLLCDWPTDSAIRSIFSNSFSLATELCETLGIHVPAENNFNLTYMELIVLIQNRKDYDISMDNGMNNESNEDSFLKENDISMAIDIASKQTDSFSSLDDDVPELDIKDFAKQVDLVKITQSTYHF